MIISCTPLVNRLAFLPDRTSLFPSSQLPKKFEEISIPTSDGERLQCYLGYGESMDRYVIYFHGNAGNIGHRMSELERIRAMGYTVLGVGYRGYGRSTGSPSEKGICLDGEAALSFVHRKFSIDYDKVCVFGRSLGTTVALELASRYSLGEAIIVTPLLTGVSYARFHGFGPVALLAGNAFDNGIRASRVRTRTLVIHGTHDDVTPYSMGQEIFRLLPDLGKSFVTIDDATHEDISQTHAHEYWSSIKAFLDHAPQAARSARTAEPVEKPTVASKHRS